MKKEIKIILIITGTLLMILGIIFFKSYYENKREEEMGDVIKNAMTNTENKKKTEDKDLEYIEGFEKAEYDRYNSYASENGLKGTKIYISARVKKIFTQDDTVGIIVEQEQGKQWVINVGTKPVWGEEKLHEIFGKEIEIFGEYMGYSENYKMPEVHIVSADRKYYFLVDEIKMPSSYFISLEGLKEISDKIIYSEYESEENKNTYKISEGIVEDITKYSKYFVNFIQKKDDSFTVQTAYIKESATLYDTKELEEFTKGDGIRLYYYVGGDGEVIFLAVEKIEPEFSIEDYINSYKEQCKEYTYKDIARNPDSVKGEYVRLTGEVIQVVESGKTVTLRVDITKNDYGYYSDTVYVTYRRKSDTEDRILENDIIIIYGKLGGLEKYTAILGQEVSLPKIFAEYIEISEE